MQSPVLAFADYTKDFLLETDASKEGLGVVLSQKQEDGWFHPVAYGSWALTTHEKNYHSTKLEFLVLKWAITEHFKEYLLYQPFLVRTDNNPLTYMMSTPNLDATGHHWVSALAKYNFQLEYQKGQNNAAADALSQVTTHLEPEAVQAILDGAAVGALQRAERENPAIIKKDLHLLETGKKADLKTLLRECIMSEDGQMVWRNHQNFTSLQGTLYLCSTPKGEDEDLLLFIVPRAHRISTLN